MAGLTFRFFKTWIESCFWWSRIGKKEIALTDVVTIAIRQVLADHEAGTDPTGQGLRDLKDLMLTVIGERAYMQALEEQRFHWKVRRDKRWEWWTDFVIRAVLTIGAAWFTWAWISYVERVLDTNLGKLTDGVLIALLTTTTANILGAWFIVARRVWQIPSENLKAPKGDGEPPTPLGPSSDTDDKDWKVKEPKDAPPAKPGEAPGS